MARLSKTSSKAGKAKARKTSQTKGSTTAGTKRRAAPAAKPRKRRSVSGLEAQLQRQTIELNEALAQQAATAEILKIINTSQGDLAPVFDIILEKAHRLCDVSTGALELYEGDIARCVSTRGMNERWEQYLRQGYRITEVLQPAWQSLRPGHVVDMRKLVERFPDEPAYRGFVEIGGLRTFLALPLVKGGIVFGRIVAARAEVRPFTDKQISLLQSFADQAVIAIENAQLFNETKEALERETATANILKVIAGSPTDVQPVFDAIAESAKRLLATHTAVVTRVIDDVVHLAASTAESEAPAHAAKGLLPYPLSSDRIHARVARTGQVAVNTDAPNSNLPQEIKEFARTVGWRSMLVVPMVRNEIAIGTIGITRHESGSFDDKTVDLLKTFASQAVIAIENARLFNETKEALERQTATADILKVIASSPSDLQPVFEAIAERSNRLVDALSTTVFTLADGMMHLRAFTPTTPEADATLHAAFPAPLSTFSWDQSIRKGEIYRVIDSEHEPEGLRDLARLRGWRSCLCVPLLRDGKPIGMIGPTRAEPGPFTDHHVQLLQTFADQAVIAISNVGLFNEVQERTRELSVSLDDLRAAQDRLVQTEKLASLGQLTAGIAHEIKNPLNFVNNFSALSAELTDELNDVLKPVVMDGKVRADVDELTGLLKDNLEKVVQHGRRADSIVKNMLLHSREGAGEQRAADINALLDESLNLAYHGARAEKPEFNITLQRDLDPDAGAIDVFPQEITRAFINLISNGFYAASKRKAENGEADFEPVLRAATKNLGNHVEIRIRDNGTGIPSEVKEKIFNPFFTTKPAGEGTGLGLSMSHDIVVKQHGGRIEVDTQLGQFTEFTIVLPRQAIIRK